MVDYVESDFRNQQGTRKKLILAHWVEQLKNDDVDTVVLACTHFLHVQDDLKLLLPKTMNIVDSRDGVGRRTKDLLTSLELLSRSNGLISHASGTDFLYYTASSSWEASLQLEMDEKYSLFARRFGLHFGGAWVL